MNTDERDERINTFGGRLQLAREEAGLTGEAVGSMVGVTRAVISHWEKNRHPVKSTELAVLCRALDKSADWLLFAQDNMSLSGRAFRLAKQYDRLSEERKRDFDDLLRVVLRGEQQSPHGIPHEGGAAAEKNTESESERSNVQGFPTDRPSKGQRPSVSWKTAAESQAQPKAKPKTRGDA